MTHPKNANKDQQVCQQPNWGVDDFDETAQKNIHADEVLELQPAVNRHQEMPHVLFWHSAPWVSLSALWFLGPLPFNTQRTASAWKYIFLFEADPSLSAPLTDRFLHSILTERCCRWAQAGSGSSSLWKVGPDSGHSTPPPIWTTDLQSAERGVSNQQETGQ